MSNIMKVFPIVSTMAMLTLMVAFRGLAGSSAQVMTNGATSEWSLSFALMDLSLIVNIVVSLAIGLSLLRRRQGPPKQKTKQKKHEEPEHVETPPPASTQSLIRIVKSDQNEPKQIFQVEDDVIYTNKLHEIREGSPTLRLVEEPEAPKEYHVPSEFEGERSSGMVLAFFATIFMVMFLVFALARIFGVI